MNTARFFFLSFSLFFNFVFPSYGVQPYYQLDFDKLDEAKAAIQTLKEDSKKYTLDSFGHILSQTCDSFLNAYALAKRPSINEIPQIVRLGAYRNAFEPYMPHNERMKSPFMRPSRTLEEMLSIIDPSEQKDFKKSAEEYFEKARVLIPLYSKYVEFYGPWREWLFRANAIGLPLKTEDPKISEKKKIIFNALVKSGFISAYQVDLENGIDFDDPTPIVYDFLDKNPQIDELRIGDEKTLSFADHKSLGTVCEGRFGMRSFKEEDMNANIMRISDSFDQNNDIPVNAHNSLFWEALLGQKGEGTFTRIKDLSWYAFMALQRSEESEETIKAQKTLGFIHKALKSGGEFSIWDYSFDYKEELPKDSNLSLLIKHVVDAGFVIEKSKSQKDTLIFTKK